MAKCEPILRRVRTWIKFFAITNNFVGEDADSSNFSGGNGGTITLYAGSTVLNSSLRSLSANGGAGPGQDNRGSGGNGGSITIYAPVTYMCTPTASAGGDDDTDDGYSTSSDGLVTIN